MPRFLRRERWSLKPPFHPYPHLSARAVFSLWHCLSATPYVVTSRVYLRPDRSYAAPCPMEFGLSSRNLRCERPSALPRRVHGGGWMRVWRVGSFLSQRLELARSCWLRLLPQELRCSLVTGLQSARASLSPRLAKESATPSLSSQLNRSGLAGLLRCSLSLIGSVWRRWVEWLAPVVSGRWGSAGWCCARRERGDTCFPVAECRGWRQGCVGGGGSAGSVLRSQGSSG